MKRQKLLCGVLTAALLTTSAVAFPDTEHHWAKKQVDRWTQAEVLKGDGKNFRPDDPLTRGEMAIILDRVMGWEETAKNSFTDLKDSSYAPAMQRAAAAGVVQGSGGKARPNDTISRQEAAVMLQRCFDLNDRKTAPKTFRDEGKVSGWARDAVDVLSARGFIGGTPEGNFQPTVNISRAAVATILDNAVDGFYTRTGSYSPGNTTAVTTGVTIIRAPGVTLQGGTVGDLLVTPGASGSETTLANVKVTGNLTVETGKGGTVVAAAGTQIATLRLTGQSARFKAMEGAKLEKVVVIGADTKLRGLPEGTQVTVEKAATGVQINGVAAAPGGTVTAPKDETTELDDIEIIVDIGGGGSSSGGEIPPPTPTPPDPTPGVKYDENGNIIIDFGDLVEGGHK